MVAEEPEGGLGNSLQQIQTRLDLAANDLPDDPEAAVRDLNTAWEALDAALSVMLEKASRIEHSTEGE